MPPMVLEIKSVVSKLLNPPYENICKNSIIRLKPKVYLTVEKKFFLYINGIIIPNGSIITIFKTSSLIDPPYPCRMSLKGTKFRFTDDILKLI